MSRRCELTGKAVQSATMSAIRTGRRVPVLANPASHAHVRLCSTARSVCASLRRRCARSSIAAASRFFLSRRGRAPRKSKPDHHEDCDSRGDGGHRATPFHRGGKSNQDPGDNHPSPGARGERGNHSPQHERDHDSIEQPRTRIGDEEAVRGHEGSRHPPGALVVERRAAHPIGQTYRLQAKQQGNESPTQRIVSKEQHAHGNQ